MKKIFCICLLMGITSCVSKSKFEELEADYQSLHIEKQDLESQLANLQDEYYEIKFDYDRIVEAKRREEIERNSKKYVSESEALSYIRDFYSFYESDTKYRNIKLRRTDQNSFKVSLEEVTSKGSFSNSDFFWSSSVYNLVVNNDDTYTYKRSF